MPSHLHNEIFESNLSDENEISSVSERAYSAPDTSGSHSAPECRSKESALSSPRRISTAYPPPSSGAMISSSAASTTTQISGAAPLPASPARVLVPLHGSRNEAEQEQVSCTPPMTAGHCDQTVTSVWTNYDGRVAGACRAYERAAMSILWPGRDRRVTGP